MTSELRQFQVAFFRFLQQFIFMAFSISSFLIFKPDSLDSIFLSLFFSVLIVFILVVVYFYKSFNIRFEFSKINKILIHRLFVSDGFKYFVNGMTTIFLLQIDIFLIDYLYGSASAGIYLIIWKIPNAIIMLGWRLSDPFAVIVANELKLNNSNKIRKQFYSLEKKLLFSAFVVSIVYFFLASFILDIWIGKENIPNINYMYLVTAIVILFSVMQRLYLSVNYYTKGLSYTSSLQFIEIIFKIIFIVFTFDYFKELAPVVGWLVAFLFTIWFYRKNSLKVFIK
jgi:O-antigen/teichoic acid export membrane protein